MNRTELVRFITQIVKVLNSTVEQLSKITENILGTIDESDKGYKIDISEKAKDKRRGGSEPN